LIGFGGVASLEMPVPSNTQSVETRITWTPVATRLRVAPTYAAQPSRSSREKSLRIAAWTITSGANASTLRRTAPASVTSTSACEGASTSSNASTRCRPTKPEPPLIHALTARPALPR
jgi:hypothetical protein